MQAKKTENMLLLTTNDLLALLIVLISAACLAFVYWLSGNSKNANLRLPETVEAIDSLLQIASEEGKPALLNLGGGFSPNPDIAGLLGLKQERMIVRRSLNADHPSFVGSSDGFLTLISQQVCHGLYRDALMPEYFNADQASLQALGPMANLASLLSTIPETKPSFLLLYGNFTPEHILSLDQARSIVRLSAVGASTATSQASLWLQADCATLGEDIFAPASDRKPEKSALTGLRTADILRIVISIGILAAAILKVMGEF